MCMIVGKQEGKKGDTVTLKREGSFIFVWKKKKKFISIGPYRLPRVNFVMSQ